MRDTVGLRDTTGLPKGDIGNRLARGYLGERFLTAPHLKAHFRAWCRAKTGREVIRVRDAWLFSTIGIVFDGAGAFTGFSSRLYAIPLGGSDPNLGTLTEVETNIRTAGKMDGDQRFIARAHGFRVTLRAAAITDEENGAFFKESITERTGSIFNTGSETRQLWGPIANQPVQAVQPVGVLGNLAAGVQGAFTTAVPSPDPAIHKTSPFVVLEPNETFSVQLVEGVAGYPSDAQLANAIYQVYHGFIGETQTIVDG